MVEKRNLLLIFIWAFLGSSMVMIIAVTFTVGVTESSVNEEVSYLYNFTITNTNGTEGNITQVDIIFDSSYSFAASTNGTSVSGASFSVSNNVLTWANIIVQNGSSANFWINATAITPGTYNITINTTDSVSVVMTDSSSQVVVNDSGNPVSSLVGPANNSYDNGNTTFICNATDEGDLSAITLYIWNASGSLNLTDANSVSGIFNETNWTKNLNFDSNYIWNCLSNDSANNLDWGINRTLNIDNVAPSITLSSASDSQTSLTITINGAEGTCVANRSGASITNSTLTESSLTCGTSYTYVVNCTDAAGNSGVSSATSFSTDACSTSSSSSGGAYTPSFWLTTYTASDDKFEEGYTRELAMKRRIRITIGDESHYVGIINLTSTTAIINVSSDSQQKVMSVGEEWKVDVNGNDFYDLLVTLNGIENFKANLTLLKIYEEVPEPVIIGDSGDESVTDEGLGVEEQVPSEEKAGKTWLWILIPVVIACVAGYTFYNRKMRKQLYGF